jgi:ferredoxin-NADP reductase
MGKFEYLGAGKYNLNRRPGSAHYLSFIAGGSGITPCYAVGPPLRALLLRAAP